MTEQAKPPKPPAEIIVVPYARLSFARIHKAEQSTDRFGKPRGTAKFSCTLLLDPSSPEQHKSIALIKQTAFNALVAQFGPQDQWPKPNPATGMGGIIKCFGNGNDLPKVYDGFKDMFYVKLSDTTRPILGNYRGKPVIEGEPECPFGGCYVRARISPWVYFPTQKNPESANGVNFNFRSLQYVAEGKPFGGGGSRSAEEEFEARSDAPPGKVGGSAFDDNW